MKNYNLPNNHLKHNIQIVKGIYGPHKYKMTCLTCNNKFVKWSTISEYKAYKEITNERNNRSRL